MSSSRKDDWDSLITEQTKTWQALLDTYGEIANMLSSKGIPMEDHYDDLNAAAEAFEKKKEDVVAFLREWHQEELG